MNVYCEYKVFSGTLTLLGKSRSLGRAVTAGKA